MALENLIGTVTTDVTTAGTHANGSQANGRVRRIVDVVEVTALANASSTYHLARLPSNCVLGLQSVVSIDDLNDSGSGTFDIGLFPVKSGDFDADDDALNDGISTGTAINEQRIVKGIENAHLPLWDFVDGLTSDPGVMMDLKITLKDVDADQGGTIAVDILYSLP